MSDVTKLLGCQYPVIQGAMALISNPELVAAVSNAGGFGLLASAFMADPEVLRCQIRKVRMLTPKAFGVNISMLNPASRELLQVIIEEKIIAVTISGGSPKEFMPQLSESKTKVLAVISTAEMARHAQDLGVDALIAKGIESGGIHGKMGVGTMVLVPAVCDAVKIPVIAAGGIADHRGYRAAIALGAEGVQVGTRFLATKECIAHLAYKQLILQSSEEDTCLLDLDSFCIRIIKTPFAHRIIADPRKNLEAVSFQAINKAWINGNIHRCILPAGQIAGIIHQVLPVADVIRTMMS